MAIPLSVLDLAPVPRGSTPADALNQSIELARSIERWGYRRHWVTEHHNLAGVASSAPPVLIAHLAAATSTLRIGAGGVMLPNHAAMAVAEQFGTLEALHPGRIDLGLGRAPGTDRAAAIALRRGPIDVEDDFPEQLRDLLAFFDGSFPGINAVPAEGYRPAIWMLGSSNYSAEVAGRIGVPFSFAHHFASHGTAEAISAYRRSFQPSPVLSEPYVMIAVPVICAPTDEEADFLGGPSGVTIVARRRGLAMQMPPPEEVADFEMNALEAELVRNWNAPRISGSPETVRKGLEELVERFGLDELMITTMVFDPSHRLRSFELIAQEWF